MVSHGIPRGTVSHGIPRGTVSHLRMEAPCIKPLAHDVRVQVRAKHALEHRQLGGEPDPHLMQSLARTVRSRVAFRDIRESAC